MRKIDVMFGLLTRAPQVLTTLSNERRDPEDVVAELSVWADAILDQAGPVDVGPLDRLVTELEEIDASDFAAWMRDRSNGGEFGQIYVAACEALGRQPVGETS